MATGYVKLHREAEDHPVFDDPWLWKVFCWCVMRANFKDGKVPRGSFTTGRIEAADRLRASPSRVYRAFDRLRTMGCITLKSNNRFTTVTICNYCTYQSDDPQERTTGGQPVNSQRTASEQLADNEKTLLEEGKEGKEGKNANGATGIPFDAPAFDMAWKSYPAKRRTKRDAAAGAWNRAIERLSPDHGGATGAASWLIARIREFAKSPAGHSKFCPSITKWISDGQYHDPIEAWQRGDDQPADAESAYEILQPFRK